MRQVLRARLVKVRGIRMRPVEQMTDKELDRIIRSDIEARGGTANVAARYRAEGNEGGALFTEFYMAGDDRWTQHVDEKKRSPCI